MLSRQAEHALDHDVGSYAGIDLPMVAALDTRTRMSIVAGPILRRGQHQFRCDRGAHRRLRV